MKTFGVVVIASGLLGVLASSASAHFVWADLRAEGGRRVALTFCEAPGEDVLPIMGRLAPKVRFVGQGAEEIGRGGSKMEGSSAAYALARPTSAVLAYVPYGVVDRGGAVYGLNYWAKAVQSPTDASRPIGKGFEIVAVPKESVWEVSAWLDGKPCADAQIVLGADDKESRGAVGAPMEIPIVPGQALNVRATREFAKGGSADGKSFAKTRDWTSLAVPGAPAISAGSDPDAYRALETATESREALRAGATPWSVEFTASNGVDALKGSATWPGQGMATVAFPGEENSYTKHVRTQLASLFMHRMSRPFGEGDGKSAIVWTDDVNELGRKVVVKDRFDSSYRLKDGRIRQVVRTIGANVLTLDILETRETAGGQYLTTRFRSVERDKATGELRSELAYQDEFRFENGDWLPASRKLEGKAGGSPIKMSVVFGRYKKLDKAVK